MSLPEDKSKHTASGGNSGAARKLTWGFAVIALVLIALALYFGLQSQQYRDQSAALSAELDDTKIRMNEELTVVQSAYDTQRIRNEELTAEVQQKVREVSELRDQIRRAQDQLRHSRSSSDQIKERLARLEGLKAELEADLLSLQQENERLQEHNADLAIALDRSAMKVEQMSTEIAGLNEQNKALDRRLTVLAPAGFRADNFRIDIEQRNDRLTAKARRADEIIVHFDLYHVPEEKQGTRSLYLTVTRPDGSPVEAIPTTTVEVPAANEPLQVQAVAVEEMDLQEKQTVAMTIPSGRDFDPGVYNIFVYSDAGYLGATGFTLR